MRLERAAWTVTILWALASPAHAQVYDQGYPPEAYAQPGYGVPPQGYAQPGYAQPGELPPGYAQQGYPPGDPNAPAPAQCVDQLTGAPVACPGQAPPADFNQFDDGYDPQAYSQFEGALAPFGSWVDAPDYGRVWVPAQNAVGPDFAPYDSGGYWTYTDVGWTWVSDYEWGWAPFHYGRWARSPRWGWFWVPGRVWGPAWVSWRRSEGFVGWAPLPPGGFARIDYDSGYNPWRFVASNGLGMRQRAYVHPTQVPPLLARAVVVDTPRRVAFGGANVHINAGPALPGFNAVPLNGLGVHVMPRAQIVPQAGIPLAQRPWVQSRMGGGTIYNGAPGAPPVFLPPGATRGPMGPAGPPGPGAPPPGVAPPPRPAGAAGPVYIAPPVAPQAAAPAGPQPAWGRPGPMAPQTPWGAPPQAAQGPAWNPPPMAAQPGWAHPQPQGQQPAWNPPPVAAQPGWAHPQPQVQPAYNLPPMAAQRPAWGPQPAPQPAYNPPPVPAQRPAWGPQPAPQPAWSHPAGPAPAPAFHPGPVWAPPGRRR